MSNLGISGTLRGDKRILKALKALPPKVQRGVIRKAARNAMRPMHGQSKANAPKGATGKLRRSIKLRAIRPRGGRIGITISSNEKWFMGPEYYAAFQEFGWHIGARESWMRSRGKWSGIGSDRDQRRWIEGMHYMEDAYKSGGDRALRMFMDEVMLGIKRAASGG